MILSNVMVRGCLCSLQTARPFEELTKALGYPIRTRDNGQIATEKSYYLYNQIAELEQALVR